MVFRFRLVTFSLWSLIYYCILFRYGADKLRKGPKVQLDRQIVEDYINYDSEEEREKAEQAKLEKIRKKNAKFAKSLKAKGPKKSPVKKVQDDGYGHEITVIDVDGM